MAFLDETKIMKKYREPACLWGLEPNKYVTRIPGMIKSGKVLDVGVGEGRNALYLAEKGFDVTGIDVSEEAVDKFRGFAGEKNVQVKGVAKNVADFEFDEDYDVVICVATLHLILRDQMLETVKKMKSYTKKNGLNLITVFTKEDAGFKEFPDLCFFDEDELKGLYGDWRILEYDNYVKEETHGKPHKHHFCVLIAKK